MSEMKRRCDQSSSFHSYVRSSHNVLSNSKSNNNWGQSHIKCFLPVGDSLVPDGDSLVPVGDSLVPVGVITEKKAQKNA